MKFLITVFAIFTTQFLCAEILDDLSKASKANPEIIWMLCRQKMYRSLTRLFRVQ